MLLAWPRRAARFESLPKKSALQATGTFTLVANRRRAAQTRHVVVCAHSHASLLGPGDSGRCWRAWGRGKRAACTAHGLATSLAWPPRPCDNFPYHPPTPWCACVRCRPRPVLRSFNRFLLPAQYDVLCGSVLRVQKSAAAVHMMRTSTARNAHHVTTHCHERDVQQRGTCVSPGVTYYVSRERRL